VDKVQATANVPGLGFDGTEYNARLRGKWQR
jgi:hypothetical protein